MSTFYVLPSRSLLGECFAGYLKTVFPGLDWATSSWDALAEVLSAATAQHADVYIVHSDDMADEESLDRALADGFGAERGDEVIEVMPGLALGELTTRRWCLGDASQTGY